MRAIARYTVFCWSCVLRRKRRSNLRGNLRVLAIIPAFNEEDCLAQTVDALMEACPWIDMLVVNDGSTDATQAICEARGYPVLTMPVNCGLACGFQAGMRYAHAHGYDAAVQYDADGQHLPQYLVPLAEKVHAGADIAIASRVLAGEKIAGARGLGSKFISALIKATTGTKVTDPTSGMRMYNAELIREYAKGFDLAPEPDALAWFARHGKRIEEVPARMAERQGGQSYLNFMNSLRYMARTCLSILLFQWFR